MPVYENTKRNGPDLCAVGAWESYVLLPDVLYLAMGPVTVAAARRQPVNHVTCVSRLEKLRRTALETAVQRRAWPVADTAGEAIRTVTETIAAGRVDGRYGRPFVRPPWTDVDVIGYVARTPNMFWSDPASEPRSHLADASTPIESTARGRCAERPSSHPFGYELSTSSRRNDIVSVHAKHVEVP